MRPRIVEALDDIVGIGLFHWLVPTPTFMYVLAILVCMILFAARAERASLNRYHAYGAALWATGCGLAGARLFYLLPRLDQVVADPGILLQLDGGTMSWGAYVGACAGFFGYLVTQREPLPRYADAAASVAGLGPFLGRFACFLAGDDFGTPSAGPWAVRFPQGSYPHQAHVYEGWIDAGAAASLPVHPVQLYLAAAGLLLFLVCTGLWKRAALPAGRLFLLYWGMDGTLRFLLEFLRGDPGRATLLGMPDGQAMALLVALVAWAAVVAATIRPQTCMPARTHTRGAHRAGRPSPEIAGAKTTAHEASDG
jgi:phosphatidylglycerol---prolipoprotein diacylglyceryl transferase